MSPTADSFIFFLFFSFTPFFVYSIVYTCGDNPTRSDNSGNVELAVFIPYNQTVTISVCQSSCSVNCSIVNVTVVNQTLPLLPSCQFTDNLTAGNHTVNLTIDAPVVNHSSFPLAIDCTVCGPDTQPLPNGTRGNCNTSLSVLGTCSEMCDTGFYSTGVATRTCGINGLLTTSTLSCHAIICDGSLRPNHTSIVSGCGVNDAYGDSCVLTCAQGFYQTNGTNTRQCLSNGPYPASDFLCSPITCNGTLLPSDTQSSSGCTANDSYQSLCIVECIQGYYNVQGNSTRQCLTNGSYPSSDYLCAPITCNGTLLPNNTSPQNGCSVNDPYGAKCILDCLTGYYHVSGNSTRVCLTNGPYNASDFVCSPITCNGTLLPNHTSPQSGCAANDAYGAQCILDCIPGFYHASGNSTRVCLTNGPYNSSDFVCSPITCNGSSIPPNTTRAVSGVCNESDAYNTNCTLTCLPGYQRVSGNTSYLCTSHDVQYQFDLVCEDIDECINNTQCDQYLSYCINTAGNWTCASCPDGFEGDGFFCNDTNECDTPLICGNSSNCVNIFGNYSCLPVLANLEGDSLDEQEAGSTLVTNISFRRNVQIQAVFVGGPNGTSECGNYQTSLPITAFNVSSFDLQLDQLTLEVPPGIGPCLYVTILCCPNASLYNQTVLQSKNVTPPGCEYITGVGNDWFGYKLPGLQPYSVRLATEPDALGNPRVNLPLNDTGTEIAFNGLNFFINQTYPGHLGVFYGPYPSFDAYPCTINYTASKPPTIIVCRTTPNSIGVINFIALQLTYYNVSGYPKNFSVFDSLNFGAFPIIDLITGCPKEGCPTEGNLTINITGRNFENPIVIYVGTSLCTNNQSQKPDDLGNNVSRIYCQLPPGVGTNLTMRITSADRDGTTANSSVTTISYAPPVILWLSSPSCNSNSPPPGVIMNCARAGGLLKVYGRNFGLAGAVVLVGSYQCKNLTYDAPHTNLSCLLPPGTSQYQPVIVILGTQISNSTQVSYTQCSAGTYQVSHDPLVNITCANCPPGFFTASDGLDTCQPCSLGTFANSSGSSGCTLCAGGTWAGDSNSTTCKQCDAGTSRPNDRNDLILCQACALEYFANVTGQVNCTPCPGGQEAKAEKSINCTLCAPGKFRKLLSDSPCTDCEPGSFSGGGFSDCTKCAENTNSVQGASMCTPCPLGTAGSNCTQCVTNTYNAFPGEGCFQCVPGLVCYQGIARADDNYYAWLNKSTGQYAVFACPPDICRNGNCTPNRVAYDQNPLCGQCLPSYVEWSGNCVKCQEDNKGVIFGLFVASFAYVIALHRISQGKSTVPLKVLSYFVAVSRYIVPSRYGVSWLSFFDFSFFTSTTGTCVAPLAPYQKLWLDFWTPAILFGELLILACGWAIYRTCLERYHADPEQQSFRDTSEFITPFVRTTISLLIYSYSHTIRICFDYLTCVDVGPYVVVFSNPSIYCDTEEYERTKGGIIFLLVVFLAGIPAFFLSHLCCKRRIFAHYELNKELHVDTMSLVKRVRRQSDKDKTCKDCQKCWRYLCYFEFGIPLYKQGERIGNRRLSQIDDEEERQDLEKRRKVTDTESEDLYEAPDLPNGLVKTLSDGCYNCCHAKCRFCFNQFFPSWNKDGNFHAVMWLIPLFSGYNDPCYWWEIWMLLRRTLILGTGTWFAEDSLYRGQAFVILNGIILFSHIVFQPFREREINIMESASLVVLILLSTLVLNAPPVLPVTNSVMVLILTGGTFTIFAALTFIFEIDQVVRFIIAFSNCFRKYFPGCECQRVRDYKKARRDDKRRKREQALHTNRVLKMAPSQLELYVEKKGKSQRTSISDAPTGLPLHATVEEKTKQRTGSDEEDLRTPHKPSAREKKGDAVYQRIDTPGTELILDAEASPVSRNNRGSIQRIASPSKVGVEIEPLSQRMQRGDSRLEGSEQLSSPSFATEGAGAGSLHPLRNEDLESPLRGRVDRGISQYGPLPLPIISPPPGLEEEQTS